MTKISDYTSTSAVDNVKRALAAAKENERYHALLSLTEERALERAAKVDAGEITGRLAGVPFVVKDNFLAFGAPTTAASKIWRPRGLFALVRPTLMPLPTVEVPKTQLLVRLKMPLMKAVLPEVALVALLS